MIARAIIVAAVALLLAFHAVRTAAVADRTTRGKIGARLWPSHPAVELNRTMAEIGVLARRGQMPSRQILRQVEEIAVKTPLAPEPFLIKGALYQAAGRQEQAARLFSEARNRDPRSDAARYFLADYYFRSRRTEQALIEMAAFARLVPNGSTQFAPALAAFAKTPGAVPHLRILFRRSPEFEPAVLAELAADAGNADLILALAEPIDPNPRAPAPAWQSRILGELVAKSQFAKALEVWRRLTGERHGGGAIFNTAFESSSAPPPFNWRYGTTGGVAEPANGRLRVIYYGRQDASLAQQLLLLPPGRYQLAMTVSGQSPGLSSLVWSVTCLPQATTIFSLPLKPMSGAQGGSFSVPANCPAQRLELKGLIGEFPQSVDVAIGNLRLKKAGEA